MVSLLVGEYNACISWKKNVPHWIFVLRLLPKQIPLAMWTLPIDPRTGRCCCWLPWLALGVWTSKGLSAFTYIHTLPHSSLLLASFRLALTPLTLPCNRFCWRCPMLPPAVSLHSSLTFQERNPCLFFGLEFLLVWTHCLWTAHRRSGAACMGDWRELVDKYPGPLQIKSELGQEELYSQDYCEQGSISFPSYCNREKAVSTRHSGWSWGRKHKNSKEAGCGGRWDNRAEKVWKTNKLNSSLNSFFLPTFWNSLKQCLQHA